MNSNEIENYFAGEQEFRGVFACDEIPSTSLRGGYIINTDRGDERGEHWVALYQNGNSTSEYFDSFGLPPVIPQILKHLIDFSPNGCRFSRLILQNPYANTCGLYCVLFIKEKLKGKTMEEFLSHFCTNSNHNEALLHRLFNK